MIITIYGTFVREIPEEGDELKLKFNIPLKISVLYGKGGTICKWEQTIFGGKEAIWKFVTEKLATHMGC
jgi:hypothetical protein